MRNYITIALSSFALLSSTASLHAQESEKNISVAEKAAPAPLKVLRPYFRWPVDPTLARPAVTLTILETSKALIDENTPGMQNVKYGNEGGELIKDHKGVYHWFTSEQFGDPYWVANRLTHWTSDNGTNWVKDTVWSKEGDQDETNTSPRSNYFNPNPVYDEETGYWYLFYMGYHYLPDVQYRALVKKLNSRCKKDNYGANRGRIYRAKSMKPGRDGLSGPYHDRDADDVVIIEPLENPPPYEATWAGDTKSGYGCITATLYQIGDEWYLIYAENLLAKSSSLTGTFKRLPEGPDNPISYQRPLMGWKPLHNYLENPVVYRIPEGSTGAGLYVMVVGMHWDSSAPSSKKGWNPSYGYATSRDGIHWSAMMPLPKIDGQLPLTSCSFIPEGDDVYAIYVTARDAKKYERLYRYKVKLTLR